MTAVVSNEKLINGAQLIGGLWRIYFNDELAREQVLCTGISLRDTQVTLKEKNPFLYPGHEFLETTRLYVRNIPLSYDNDIILDSLKDMGVNLLGPLKYARARTPEGHLTNVKTGDRFAEITVPNEPLPKKKQMGIFTASLYHKEQKQALKDKACENCKDKGHLRKDCTNETVCYECMKPGHKRGSPLCEGFSEVMDGPTPEEVNEKTDNKDESENEDESEEGEVEEEEEKEEEEEEEEEEGKKEREKDTPYEKSAEQKTKQGLITALWKAAAQGTASTSAAGRDASPARVRKATEITPEKQQTDPKN